MLKNLRTETTIGNEFKNKLIDVVGRRFCNLERDKIVAKSTFLDPRLKKKQPLDYREMLIMRINGFVKN